MSGITGFYNLTASQTQDELENSLRRMGNTIRHRGPDDAGLWADVKAGLALGCRRLAILDPTPTGRQPMASSDGRYVITCDGRIFNHMSLREELLGLGHIFAGPADVEVMLAAIRQWGLESALQRFNGMFAFALWDSEERTLHLVRDRLGVKPLYYSWMGRTFLFGSELKALRAHPVFRAEIERNALALFLRYGYIPTPFSIYRGVEKLAPGQILTIWPGSEAGDERRESYWSPRAAVEKGLTNPFDGSESAAQEALENLLSRSINLRMATATSFGAFLTGDAGSALIAALMKKQNSRAVRTFSLGFQESNLRELEHAREVAKHLGTDHIEIIVSAEQAFSTIPRLPTLFDEPFSDQSQIPTILAAQLARQHSAVGISGAGGDELFGNCERYQRGLRAWKTVNWLPTPLRRVTAQGLSVFSSNGNRLRRIIDLLNTPIREALYLELISHWSQPGTVVINGQEPLTTVTDPLRWMNTSTFVERMMSLDLVTCLPDNTLTNLDRASMGFGLEALAPFADDQELIEFAWKLPMRMKIHNGQGKWILRKILHRYLPPRLVDRKVKFSSAPIAAWLRGPLKAWGEDLLQEDRLRREGFFQPEPIRQKWQEHLSGQKNWEIALWDILMFETWIAANHGS